MSPRSRSIPDVSSTERPSTAQGVVLAQLRQMIVNGDLAPGDPIRQDAVAERLNISRLPLREALKVLEGEGQVVYWPHRGYRVRKLSIEDLLEVYRLRELLESEAVRESVAKMSDDQLTRIVQAESEFERAHALDDVTAMMATNRLFHFTILEGALMPRLMQFVRILWDSTDAYRSIYYYDARNRRLVIREHRATIRAIKSGDAEKVVQLLNGHRDSAILAVRRVVGSRPHAAARITTMR